MFNSNQCGSCERLGLVDIEFDHAVAVADANFADGCQ
ncbi:MAG: hypothetical protein ACD_39C00744G0001, partial [uncultured bacterium]